MTQPNYYRYWGKAKRGDDTQGEPYHLLVYHSLDVAAVADQWWQQSPVIRRAFLAISNQDEPITRAWLLFFIALHDLGKFDVRFQMKVPTVATKLWQGFADSDPSEYRHYWHGEYSYHWLFNDFDSEFAWQETDWDEAEGAEIWAQWKPWLQAVAGHHGVEPNDNTHFSTPNADLAVLQRDREARKAFVYALEDLFLTPVSLSIHDYPPRCDLVFLAGFCSVCDWLGSTVNYANDDPCFNYQTKHEILTDYFPSRFPIVKRLLAESGLLSTVNTTGGMHALFPQFTTPHQVQTLVETLPVTTGLTLIEAPTGSGKTEAALAYASYLLAEGKAESIIFALPTQATANAMLTRLIAVSKKLYQDTDLVLAHGKARFNDLFIDLKKAATHNNTQDAEHELEASIQCAQWLSQSRKRVFLGQIGVCTVDQVLLSVLAIKHRFVRAFGLGKSVLIIDEVHAYDSYMYGLLNKVLIQQRNMQGSAILLSATLPLFQRQQLLATWGDDSTLNTDVLTETNDYPLISHCHHNNNDPSLTLYPLPTAEKERLAHAEQRRVYLASLETGDMLPDESLLDSIIQAAEQGANVVIICNLVADAQSLAAQLQTKTERPIDLFHSRYRFKDRQIKENKVLDDYGKGKQRQQGGILVATQVVEQSLDLDFDWMITQLCPIDLLFQRLGRLHRHQRQRPAGFAQPRCTVLLPENEDYQLHKLIYGNSTAPNARVLWRTEQLIKHTIDADHPLRFPDVYRPMIEDVYREAAWDNEPERITNDYELFKMGEEASRMVARSLTEIENVWDDDNNAKVNALTRDGEMSVPLIPVIKHNKGFCFLEEEQTIASLEIWQQREALMLNTLHVPASWEKYLHKIATKKEGIFYLVMTKDNDEYENVWQTASEQVCFHYSIDKGLEREKI